jgi:hypothetical protein
VIRCPLCHFVRTIPCGVARCRGCREKQVLELIAAWERNSIPWTPLDIENNIFIESSKDEIGFILKRRMERVENRRPG